MTRLLQEGKLGRFEQSFHDLDEEIRLMADGAAQDGHRTPEPTMWQRLLRRTAAAQVAAH